MIIAANNVFQPCEPREGTNKCEYFIIDKDLSAIIGYLKKYFFYYYAYCYCCYYGYCHIYYHSCNYKTSSYLLIQQRKSSVNSIQDSVEKWRNNNETDGIKSKRKNSRGQIIHPQIIKMIKTELCWRRNLKKCNTISKKKAPFYFYNGENRPSGIWCYNDTHVIRTIESEYKLEQNQKNFLQIMHANKQKWKPKKTGKKGSSRTPNRKLYKYYAQIFQVVKCYYMFALHSTYSMYTENETLFSCATKKMTSCFLHVLMSNHFFKEYIFVFKSCYCYCKKYMCFCNILCSKQHCFQGSCFCRGYIESYKNGKEATPVGALSKVAHISFHGKCNNVVLKNIIWCLTKYDCIFFLMQQTKLCIIYSFFSPRLFYLDNVLKPKKQRGILKIATTLHVELNAQNGKKSGRRLVIILAITTKNIPTAEIQGITKQTGVNACGSRYYIISNQLKCTVVSAVLFLKVTLTSANVFIKHIHHFSKLRNNTTPCAINSSSSSNANIKKEKEKEKTDIDTDTETHTFESYFIKNPFCNCSFKCKGSFLKILGKINTISLSSDLILHMLAQICIVNHHTFLVTKEKAFYHNNSSSSSQKNYLSCDKKLRKLKKNQQYFYLVATNKFSFLFNKYHLCNYGWLLVEKALYSFCAFKQKITLHFSQEKKKKKKKRVM